MRDLNDDDLNTPILEKENLAGQGGGLLTSVGEEISNSIRGLDAGVGAVEAVDKPALEEEEKKAQDLAGDEGEVANEEAHEELAEEGTQVDENTGGAAGEGVQTYTGVGESEAATPQAQVQLASYAGLSAESTPVWESAAREATRPEAFQAVEDGYFGPPPPHDFEQSGCACACCAEGGEAGSGGAGGGGVGVPAAATSLDNLSRFLSEYNHANTADEDFWDGFWDSAGDSEGPNYHWNLTNTGLNAQNGVITYNVMGNNYDADGITDDGADATSRIDAIRHALNIYEDMLGINFSETTNVAADLNFGNESSGAFANFNADGKTANQGATGSISNAWINIAKSWTGNGTIGDYYFATVLHEVGHALGLGHQGLYNAGGGATYGNQALWENDTIQFSMMSYWAQNNYTAPGESTPSGTFLNDVNFIGPQAVDWLALDRMYNPMGYGIDDGVTGSNTTWGFNSTWSDWTPTNSGPLFGYANTAYASLDTLLSSTTMTIVDAGGTDTLDLSGFSNNTKIDVSNVSSFDTKPSISNVAGLNGNLMIGVGTVIENVVGGSGGEEIIGNSSANNLDGNGGNDSISGGNGNDTLIGDTGNDTLLGEGGNDSLDGGADNDFLVGGGSVDTLLGGEGNDTLEGGFSTDSISGGGGDDLIRVLEGEYYDSVDGGSGVDTLDHSDSDYSGDVFNFSTGVMSGTNFNGGSGTVTGVEIYLDGSGDNTIHSDGSGLFEGNGGNDTIHAGNGVNETLNGGSGTDTLNTTHFSGNYVVNLATGLTNFTGESFINFENLISGSGNDSLTGTNGNNNIDGGAGNDTLNAGSGTDTLFGGEGNDRLNRGGGGSLQDAYYGGAGIDTIGADGVGFASTVVFNLATGFMTLSGNNYEIWNGFENYDGSTGSGGEGVIGTSGDNLIETGSGNNSIDGGAGNDTISSTNGNDTLNGGSGNDTLIVSDDGGDTSILGGLGEDLLDLSGSTAGWVMGLNDLTSGSTTLSGANSSNGVDALLGSDFDDDLTEGYIDVIDAAGGNDSVRTNGINVSDERFDGGAGNDLLDFSADSSDILLDLATGAFSNTIGAFNFENAIGGSGNDTITGVAGGSNLAGGDGIDSLTGLGGSDTLLGGSGNDVLIGGGGGDGLNGGTGNDILSGDGGADTLVGGSGDDILGGGSGNDHLSGGFQGDVLSGGLGNDTLLGDGGNDLLDGGGGADNLDGGTGIDTLSYASDSSGVTVNLTSNTASGGNATGDIITGFEDVLGGTGNDSLTGSVSNNKLVGGGGGDTLSGSNGDDTLNGKGGNDSLLGGADNDTLLGGFGKDTLLGGGGDDKLTGGGGNDSLNGVSGSDTLLGSGGQDNLLGGGGNDSLDGGTGGDILNGGIGDDTLTGGGGTNDVFVFTDGFGNDVVSDFNSANLEDIDLSGVTNITNFVDLINNHLFNVGGFAVIVDGSDSILLDGVAFADVGIGQTYSGADFIF